MKIALVRVKYNSYIITPPLGIGYLSSYLKQNGHETLIIDALRDNLSNEEITEIINNNNIDVVGITCLSAFYKEVCELSQLLKKYNKTVVIGGVHPSFLPEDTLKESQADFVIVGEGEIAMLQLLNNNFNIDNIKGVYNLKNIQKKLEFADRIDNLDNLPFPDWEQINPAKYPYAPHGAVSKNFPIGIIMSTRGCPYSCKFCSSPHFYERKIRFRSPENVVNEIEYLIKNFGVKEIHFEDDNLTLKREHIIEICNLINNKNIKISFACPNGIRADRVDKDLLMLMKKTGFYSVAFGIESANAQILKNINKSESIDKIKRAISLSNDCKISSQGFFIFGLPGETKETIEETIDFAVNSKLKKAQFLILDVLPGCELYDELKGKFQSDFSKNSYMEPEWIPEGLTKKDLINAQSSAFKRFYLRTNVFLYMLKFISIHQIKFLFERIFVCGHLKK